MIFTIGTLEQIILDGCADLAKKQPMLLTKKFDVNERTISGELSKVISKYFDGYDVNCEYNRMTDENGIQIVKRLILDVQITDPKLVYPDIIVHHQVDDKHNLLVIEIKMKWKNREKEFDIKKLRAFTTQLGYSCGLYLELGENEISELVWIFNGEIINK